MAESSKSIIDELSEFQSELDSIAKGIGRTANTTPSSNALRRWVERLGSALQEQLPLAAARLSKVAIPAPTTRNAILQLRAEVKIYEEFLRGVLQEESSRTPEEEAPAAQPEPVRVFIIHGHDYKNLRRLERLLTQLGVEPVVLRDTAGRGLTIIEKFEREADTCRYAIALFTPDDLVSCTTARGTQVQARPNVIFELGWFFGRLRRDKVLLLTKRGTSIFSDIEGLQREEFEETVDESQIAIERELSAAGILEEVATPSDRGPVGSSEATRGKRRVRRRGHDRALQV